MHVLEGLGTCPLPPHENFEFRCSETAFGNNFSAKNKYLIQNSKAVKKVCGPQKGYGEKRCEIQGGGQEMAVMVG